MTKVYIVFRDYPTWSNKQSQMIRIFSSKAKACKYLKEDKEYSYSLRVETFEVE